MKWPELTSAARVRRFAATAFTRMISTWASIGLKVADAKMHSRLPGRVAERGSFETNE
jgi:hypothetical protein